MTRRSCLADVEIDIEILKARSFFLLAIEFDGFPHICGVRGKLKFLLRFGLIVSVLFYFVLTH